MKGFKEAYNSTLRVERRKWGNADEREVRHTRSKVITSCRAREWQPEAEGRGFLSREIALSRDHLRPSAANFTRVCMTAFASRCVYYFTRWGHGNWRLEWLQFIIAGMRVVGGAGTAEQVEGRAEVRGATLVGFRGEAPAGGPEGGAPRMPWNELKMFHEPILSRNETWFVKIRKQMTTARARVHTHTHTHTHTHLLVSLPGFRWQQLVGDDSVRLCI